MNNIPRTFCVTLEKSSTHQQFIKGQASKLGFPVEFFHGIDGKALGLTPFNFNVLEYPNDEVYISGGSIGCTLSHLMLWKMLQYLPENEFFIIEDDAIFPEDFTIKFQELYPKLPSDWEMVYVGWITYGKDICPIKIKDGISSRLPSATHAYMVKKSVLPTLMAAMYPLCSPIDITLIKKVIPNIKCYVFDPSLLSQKTYLNIEDPDWFSEGYNWKVDSCGLVKKLLAGFKFGEGWYSMENMGTTNKWKWSSDIFMIHVPLLKTPYKLVLTFTSEKENELTIIFKDGVKEFHPIGLGLSTVDIKIDKVNSIKGVLKNNFIPSKEVPNSRDTRVLGICLRDVILDMDKVVISDIFSKMK